MTVLATLERLALEEPRVLDWACAPIPSLMAGEGPMRAWLEQGMHGDMEWLKTHMEVRANPSLLWPGMQTVVMFLWRLPGPLRTSSYEAEVRVSSYAQGDDYHVTLGRFLDKLRKDIAQLHDGFAARTFVDAMPVMEREFAMLAGLGWKGKNSMLLHKQHGSAFVLGGIACNQVLERQGPHFPDQEFCRSCTLCIEACPTGAIGFERTIDSRKCLSWINIEKKGDHLPAQRAALDHWLFGCDLCQSCCPWNTKQWDDQTPAHWPETITEWKYLLEPGHGLRSRIKPTPLSRVGRKGLERNLQAIEEYLSLSP